MAEGNVAHSFEQDLSEVRGVGFLAAFLIALAIAPDLVLNYIIGAVTGHAELDADGVKLLVSALVLTGPLSIAVGLIALAASRRWFPVEWLPSLLIIGSLLIAGVVLGNALYGLVGIPFQIVLNTSELSRVMTNQVGNPEIKLAAGILSILLGYLLIFGPAYFFVAFVSGAFAGYAVSRLLFSRL